MINTILCGLLAIWLAKAILKVVTGVLQIVVGLFCGIVGMILITTALVLERLWIGSRK